MSQINGTEENITMTIVRAGTRTRRREKSKPFGARLNRAKNREPVISVMPARPKIPKPGMTNTSTSRRIRPVAKKMISM